MMITTWQLGTLSKWNGCFFLFDLSSSSLITSNPLAVLHQIHASSYFRFEWPQFIAARSLEKVLSHSGHLNNNLRWMVAKCTVREESDRWRRDKKKKKSNWNLEASWWWYSRGLLSYQRWQDGRFWNVKQNSTNRFQQIKSQLLLIQILPQFFLSVSQIIATTVSIQQKKSIMCILLFNCFFFNFFNFHILSSITTELTWNALQHGHFLSFKCILQCSYISLGTSNTCSQSGAGHLDGAFSPNKISMSSGFVVPERK